ncbi:glycoside hydrolase family 127 protein [Demequina mangrovi]|uniref:Glycoside hydrolase family 127 protein n=1 Tax=Demequina mangrovi TaxID=1043493 RepID=A0A1H6W2A3_9MICO|nr:beta-L-arabinofuranosidase domain-containing protein [Demequina mangrovi]SEJ11069.1 hypothetical protein SAMN05421637_0810 [Demequina mangrovi]
MTTATPSPASRAHALASGPVRPTDRALAAQHPVPAGRARLASTDELGAWQERCASVTVPHVLEQLEASGVLPNLRRVADGETQPYVGMPFADSDLYKALEALAWEAARTGDDAHAGFVDAAVDLLERAQDPDGYLDSWIQVDRPEQRWQDLAWHHELYCAGHLIQAAVAWSRATGEQRLMGVARRLADHIDERFGPGRLEGIPGHPLIETALVELFRETGERRYLELAATLVERRGRVDMPIQHFSPIYYQHHVPVREATAAAGHVVRQLYLTTGALDVAVETGDLDLLVAVEAVWRDAIERKTYVTGGQGSRHRDESFGDPYELPSDRAYAETCAAIASFMLSYRLLLVTGRAEFAVEMERVLRNGILSGVSLDGLQFFYSNPLQVRRGHIGGEETAMSERLSWYACACCPPNLIRFAASLGSYVATEDAEGLTLQMPVAGEFEASGDAWRLEVAVETDAPYGGLVAARVTAATGRARLRLRVPIGAEGLAAAIDGEPIDVDTEDGYVTVTRRWAVGEVLEIRSEAPVRALRPHPRIDAVRGSLAIMRGPLVYCIESASWDRDASIDEIRVEADAIRAAVEVPLPELGTVGLRFDARVIADADALDLYVEDEPAGGGEGGDDASVVAVPYARWANRGPGEMRVWIPEARR